MKPLVKYSLTLLVLAVMAGCRAESRKLEAPLTPYEKSELKSDRQTFDVSPKVTMLLVVDYSTSMTAHQDSMSRNIPEFVNEIAKNVLVDFHIAVLPMYDHVHCRTAAMPQVVPNGFPVGTCYPFGELLPLRNPSYKPGSLVESEKNLELPGPRYVTRSTPNMVEVLKKTILMGEQKGPAFEEMFSPVIPALTQPSLTQGPNKGFMQDGLFVLVFLTDGDDSDNPGNSITAGEMASAVLGLKNGNANLISTVAVISPSNAPCANRDQSGKPKKIEEFIQRTKGDTLSLCSADFGKKLAKIGSDISVKVEQQKITLNGVPDSHKDKEFELYYGNQKLSRAQKDSQDGWEYEKETQTIYIGNKTKLNNSPDSKLNVKFTSIPLSSVQAGKVTVRQ